MSCGHFVAYSMMAVLLSCSLGDWPNATRCIVLYLELNDMSGPFFHICNFCSFAAASAVLWMSESFARITSLISLSVDSSDRSARMCNIDGAIPWHTSSLNGLLQYYAVTSIWLS